MSFRYRVEQVGPNKFVLPKLGKMRCPVTAFLSPALLEQTNEKLWRQVATAACTEGAIGFYLMPDTHVGFGIPIGGVLVTDSTIVQAGSGYDISCGILHMKVPGLHASDIVDWDTRLRWVREVELRVATGLGSHRPRLMKKTSHREMSDVLRYGAKALKVGADLC